ncbi:MAG TPA: ABC transporter ATP-binding protein [Oscillospiraceae bacterium]|nr:ABC transporter ATP-binding protein [Oscillospiraceae bacterium]
MICIESESLAKSFGKFKAVNNLSFSIEENKITGLVGRNGAGKTTLLKLLAGYLLPSSGEVRVFGQTPFNNLHVAANLIFIDDQLELPDNLNLGETLAAIGQFYANWRAELARGLLDYFSLQPQQYYANLSKGMKSSLKMIIGIAARCPLTIFDEPTVGMDVAVRKDFYRALLKDFMQYPRTIIFSSHLLSEIEELLDDLLLIKAGEKYLHLPLDELKGYAVGFTGQASIINKMITPEQILYQRQLGKDSIYLVARNTFNQEILQQARLQGVEISPVATDDLSIYLTAQHKGGIDNVFSRT